MCKLTTKESVYHTATSKPIQKMDFSIQAAGYKKKVECFPERTYYKISNTSVEPVWLYHVNCGLQGCVGDYQHSGVKSHHPEDTGKNLPQTFVTTYPTTT